MDHPMLYRICPPVNFTLITRGYLCQEGKSALLSSVADNIYLRKPTLLREGSRWFNRIGPAMLRSIGFDELIAVSDTQYKQKLVRLTDDEEYRASLCGRLASIDLDESVFKTDGTAGFTIVPVSPL